MAEGNSFDSPMIDPIGYIVWNNPHGVQKVLYDNGGQPSTTKDELFQNVVGMLSKKGEALRKQLFAIHPDKEVILKETTEETPAPAGPKKSYACGCNKSNFVAGTVDQQSANRIENLINEKGEVNTIIGECSKRTKKELEDEISEIEQYIKGARLTSSVHAGLTNRVKNLNDCLDSKKNLFDKMSTPQKAITVVSIAVLAVVVGKAISF